VWKDKVKPRQYSVYFAGFSGQTFTQAARRYKSEALQVHLRVTSSVEQWMFEADLLVSAMVELTCARN
jgi:hypothetical protein